MLDVMAVLVAKMVAKHQVHSSSNNYCTTIGTESSSVKHTSGRRKWRSCAKRGFHIVTENLWFRLLQLTVLLRSLRLTSQSLRLA